MRSYYCEMRGAAKKWLEECDEEMKRLLAADPNSIPGWKLEDGVIQTPIVNPQEAFNRLLAVAGSSEFTAAELLPLFMECVKVGKTDLQALVRKVTGLKGKPLNKAWEDMLSGITESKQNKPSLGKMTAAEMAAQEPEPEKVVDVS